MGRKGRVCEAWEMRKTRAYARGTAAAAGLDPPSSRPEDPKPGFRLACPSSSPLLTAYDHSPIVTTPFGLGLHSVHSILAHLSLQAWLLGVAISSPPRSKARRGTKPAWRYTPPCPDHLALLSHNTTTHAAQAPRAPAPPPSTHRRPSPLLLSPCQPQQQCLDS